MDEHEEPTDPRSSFALRAGDEPDVEDTWRFGRPGDLDLPLLSTYRYRIALRRERRERSRLVRRMRVRW